MDEEQLAKIESAAAKCLAGCDDATPFVQMKRFITELRADHSWTQDEIIEVQARVIRVLMYRLQNPPAGNT